MHAAFASKSNCEIHKLILSSLKSETGVSKVSAHFRSASRA